MSNFDFSKFKKISTDKQSTVLKHKDGHTLKIAHGKLSPKLKSELDKLPIHSFAEGGGVSKMPTDEFSQSMTDQPPEYKDELSDLPKMTPGEEQIQSNVEDLKKTYYGMDDESLKRLAQDKALKEAEINSASQNAEQETLAKTQQEDEAYNAKAQKYGLPLRGQPPQSVVQGPSPAQASPAVAEVPAQTQQIAPAVSTPVTGAPPTQVAELPAQQPAVSGVQKFQQTKQSINQALNDEDAAWEHDLRNGHITPETYQSLYNKQDTLGKVGTMFGLLLSGVGGQNGSNAVLQMMDNEIKRDMEAKTTSKTNAYNANLLHQNAPLVAAQAHMTEEQAKTFNQTRDYNAKMQTTFQDLVNKSNALPPGPQKDANDAALGYLYSGIKDKIYNNNAALAGSVAFMKMLNPQGAAGDIVDPEQQFQQKQRARLMLGPAGETVNKYETERHVPGFSRQSSNPIDHNKAEELKKYAEYDEQLKRLVDWTKENHAIVPWNPANKAKIDQGRLLAQMAQQGFRKAQLNTVFRPSESPLLDQAIPADPSKFLKEYTVLPKLEALRKENMAQLNTAAHKEGLGEYIGGHGAGAPMSGINKDEIEVPLPNGKTPIYDAITKKFIRWK